jgi:hypothetical protein
MSSWCGRRFWAAQVRANFLRLAGAVWPDVPPLFADACRSMLHA